MTTLNEAKECLLDIAKESLELDLTGDELLNTKVDLLDGNNVLESNLTLSQAVDFVIKDAKLCSNALANELYKDAIKEYNKEEPIGPVEKDIIYYDIRLSGDDDSEGGYINIGYDGDDFLSDSLKWFKEYHNIR